MLMQNYYKILGVDSKATKEEIMEAYYNKLKQYHPDIAIGKIISNEEKATLTQKFKIASKAYETLSSQEKREEYDKLYERYLEEVRQEEEAFQRAQEEKKRQNSWTQAYKEVRQDEQSYDFISRHTAFNQLFRHEFEGKVDSFPKEVAFRMGQGTVHVFGEALYQIRKLGYITKDNFPRFVLRNRGLIGGILVAGTLITAANIKDKEPTELGSIPEATPIVEEQVETVSREENKTYTLMRNYRIPKGDTLSEISENARTPIEEIQDINHIHGTTIYAGDHIRIPYTIPEEDLMYYTYTIKVGNQSLEDITRMYETDIDTLMTLNEGSITWMNGNYILFSEDLRVPHFITMQEYNNITENNIVKR